MTFWRTRTGIYGLEYKGGAGKLSRGQMDKDWVKKKIKQLIEEVPSNPWGLLLEQELASGSLRGIVVSTPISKAGAGATKMIKEIKYTP